MTESSSPPALNEEQALKLATHRHYKGGLYRVIGVAKHSEDLSPMVVYQHLWPHEPGLWVRPRDMFYGHIEDGRLRFTPLEPAKA